MKISDSLDLNILWIDGMLPFSFQYNVETDHYMWDLLNGREYRHSPS